MKLHQSPSPVEQIQQLFLNEFLNQIFDGQRQLWRTRSAKPSLPPHCEGILILGKEAVRHEDDLRSFLRSLTMERQHTNNSAAHEGTEPAMDVLSGSDNDIA